MNTRILFTVAVSLLGLAACDKRSESGPPDEGHVSLHARATDEPIAPVAAAPRATVEVAVEQPTSAAQPAEPMDRLAQAAALPDMARKAADAPGAKVADEKSVGRGRAVALGKASGSLGMVGIGSGGGAATGGTRMFVVSAGDAVPPPPVREEREQYGKIDENPVRRASEVPVSTFSIDVDTGSYANVRRLIREGRRPPQDAVRVEELINYFTYDYPVARTSGHPFAVSTEVAPCPWNSQNLLVRIGLRATDVDKAELPPANLVFLVDVSGSMQPEERLPLLQKSLKLLVDQLRPQDRVSLVTYASGTRVVLTPTSGAEKSTILNAIDDLRAGGSTAGEAGIQLAYRMAQSGFIQGGINRILLGTDGDFNVGVTNFEDLKTLAADKRKTGVSLTTLGFGVGNYNEHLMEQLADAGDGSYAYIDTLNEGHKVLVEQMTQTLAVVAKDVKIQVEFNPAAVSEYRQIGYENRALKREDFNNDKVDAGEVGAGVGRPREGEAGRVELRFEFERGGAADGIIQGDDRYGLCADTLQGHGSDAQRHARRPDTGRARRVDIHAAAGEGGAPARARARRREAFGIHARAADHRRSRGARVSRRDLERHPCAGGHAAGCRGTPQQGDRRHPARAGRARAHGNARFRCGREHARGVGEIHRIRNREMDPDREDDGHPLRRMRSGGRRARHARSRLIGRNNCKGKIHP